MLWTQQTYFDSVAAFLWWHLTLSRLTIVRHSDDFIAMAFSRLFPACHAIFAAIASPILLFHFVHVWKKASFDHINIYIDSFLPLLHRKFHLSIKFFFYHANFLSSIYRLCDAIDSIDDEKRCLSHQNATTWNIAMVSHSINSHCSTTKQRKRDWYISKSSISMLFSACTIGGLIKTRTRISLPKVIDSI